MEKVKTIVDREPVSSDYIGSKQNFGHVLSQVKNLKPPIWKTGWFYGPVGVAVIAITLSITTIDPISGETDKSKTTSKDLKAFINETTPTQKITYSVNADARPKKEVHTSLVPDQAKISQSQTNVKETAIVEEKMESEPVIRKPKVSEESVIARKNFLPHFQGNYTGDIPLEALCSAKGIECNDEIRVIGFHIQYFTGSMDKSTKVVGNKIPQNICEMIAEHNVGNMIFITEIKGVNLDGRVVSLTSLNFTPTN